MIEIHSSGIARIPLLAELLGAAVTRFRPWRPAARRRLQAIAGWGAKPTAQGARRRAARLNLPYLALEDGFLRSFGTGQGSPTLSLVVDRLGIYYDATRPSELEAMLASDTDLLADLDDAVPDAISRVRSHRLSKYNHTPFAPPELPPAQGRKRVLVVDQTQGDMSVTLGLADAETFACMLDAARAEHPGALIHVKTHPEVVAGAKAGYLSDVVPDADVVLLDTDMNALGLIEQMDHVYVVSSQMGFEALLAGKPVTCFGMPWYAGWGLTDDRQQCERRTRIRTLEELFAAAYFHYTRYIDPLSHGRGTIFDVIDWLVRQRAMAARMPSRTILVGTRRWKSAHLSPMLSPYPGRVLSAEDATQAAAFAPKAGEALAFWGAEPPAGLAELAEQSGAALVAIEDGFMRSVGLGSDLIKPLSLALDGSGIYFDPRRESDLERELNYGTFTQGDCAAAQRIRAFIVAHGITKYNVAQPEPAGWDAQGREVVLVPGQVEDDASVRFGCDSVRTNLALLAEARLAHPDAYLVYKPHPDVLSRNRRGKVAQAEALEYADHIELELSVVSCIEACDVVHTMTSLSGFDALLRGKRVVVYGQPFYAGWGLTEDRGRIVRRARRLSLDQLVAGTLLRYPLYWDWELRGYTTCEAVLTRIMQTREALQAQGRLASLRAGYARRQVRKLQALWQARLSYRG
ncbi:MAG: capsular polysaccharide biosynthesis protein [Bordetella sp.]|nr:capsular polysaccharide biosynthesis protein [Bordetella sp.]